MNIGAQKFLEFAKTAQTATPAKAFQALTSGLEDELLFIYSSMNILPLNIRPIDLEDIDRILSQRKLPLSTLLLLRDTLNELSLSLDPEIRLFSAESFNIIEGRFNAGIDSALHAGDMNRCIELYYELALINQSHSTIYHFYLEQTVFYYLELSIPRACTQRELEYVIRALILLDRPEDARGIATTHLENDEYAAGLRLLLIEIAFMQKQHIEIPRQLALIHDADLNEEDRRRAEILRKEWEAT